MGAIINNNSILYFRHETETAYNIFIRYTEFLIYTCLIKIETQEEYEGSEQEEYDDYYLAGEGTKNYYKKFHNFTALLGVSTNCDFRASGQRGRHVWRLSTSANGRLRRKS